MRVNTRGLKLLVFLGRLTFSPLYDRYTTMIKKNTVRLSRRSDVEIDEPFIYNNMIKAQPPRDNRRQGNIHLILDF